MFTMEQVLWLVYGLMPMIISTEFTRARTLQLIAAEVKNRPAASSPSDLSMRSLPQFKAATLTFTGKITLYTGKDSVEIYATGAAHTGGDAFAYFPRHGVVATGDLYITNSCPDIDHGMSRIGFKSWTSCYRCLRVTSFRGISDLVHEHRFSGSAIILRTFTPKYSKCTNRAQRSKKCGMACIWRSTQTFGSSQSLGLLLRTTGQRYTANWQKPVSRVQASIEPTLSEMQKIKRGKRDNL